MADDLKPIVVKRVKKVVGGHHGGAWKIAFADFMTAMMAFFLVMWLLGNVSKSQLKGISQYFSTPIKMAMSSGAGVGSSNSIIQGGGKDLSRAAGESSKGQAAGNGLKSRPKDLKAAKQELERLENERFQQLKSQIESTVEGHKVLKMFSRQMMLDITSDGLRVQIVDEQNRPMFGLASAELESYTREILSQLGAMLNDVPNKISIAGHTDAKPFSGGSRGYSNWELSTDRANACRRALIAGGLDESKVVRVVGLADSVLLDKDNPESPQNRRISIILMNKKTEEAVLQETESVNKEQEDAVTATDLKKAMNEGNKAESMQPMQQPMQQQQPMQEQQAIIPKIPKIPRIRP